MSFLIKYVNYKEENHVLKINAHRIGVKEESIFIRKDSQDVQPHWLSNREYTACTYLFQCIDAIKNGVYTLDYGEYFTRNDLKTVMFTVESEAITASKTMLEYVFIGKSYGTIRFKEVPSLMVNIPFFNVLEEAFLKQSPHRLRLLT